MFFFNSISLVYDSISFILPAQSLSLQKRVSKALVDTYSVLLVPRGLIIGLYM